MPPKRTSRRRKRSDSSISKDGIDKRCYSTESEALNLENYARDRYSSSNIDYLNNVRFHLKDDGTCATFFDNNDTNVTEEFWEI